MNSICGYSRRLVLVGGGMFLLGHLPLFALPNVWTNTVGGFWRVATNWSLASAPNSDSNFDPTLITNTGSKSITIDAATPLENLSVRTLTISAPVGYSNRLELLNVPLGTPLTITRPFLVGNRAALAITNSAVLTQDTFEINDGSLELHSGSLNCAVSCDLESGNITIANGSLTLAPGSTGVRVGRFSGANAILSVNGGTLTTPRITLGSVAGSATALSLSGGTIICSDSFSAAQQPATVGNVTMSSGNLFVTNGTAKIADRAAATFEQTGGQVALAQTSIGDLGVGTYNLVNGSFLAVPRTINDLFIIGNLENGELNQTGGFANVREEIHVADSDTVTGYLRIHGGQFHATNDLVAIGRIGTGILSVSNSVVVMTNTSVGRQAGSFGTIEVHTGGNLHFVADLSVGRFAGASGQVSVHGGLLAVTNDDLWIGRGGDGAVTLNAGLLRVKNLHVAESDDGTNSPTGTLTINGGVASVTEGFRVGTPSLSTGGVTLAGGILAVTNTSGTARFAVNAGSFSSTGGNLDVDFLHLNSVAGGFAFASGAVRTKASTVANGAPFIVGDGVQLATMILPGGVHSFSDGLEIAANATLQGCATIVGNVTNHGTILANCPTAPLIVYGSFANFGRITESGGGQFYVGPIILTFSKGVSTRTVTCTSVVGTSYTLEYKNALTNGAWTALAPTQPGTGSTLTFTDSTAAPATRFYRIRGQ